MTYAELVRQIEVHAVTAVSEEAEFAAAMPGFLVDAELRCLRDCDFPSARKTVQLSVGIGAVAIAPPTDMVVPRALYRTVGLARSEIERRDSSFLREFWPDNALTGVPRYFATTDSATLQISPPPAVVTTIDMEYTFRPAGLSPSVPTTWLGDRYPDLLFYAVMVLVSGYQRNFGLQAGSQGQPESWAKLYGEALAVARNEAQHGKGWGSFDRTPTPPPSSLTPGG